MKVAYADPPYLGCCAMYQHEHGDGGCWNDVETHQQLIARLCEGFPDGWALSTTSTSLRVLLPLCPEDVRVAAYTKKFVSFKPNITPGFAWEPVIFRGGRKRTREQWIGRDWVSAMPPVFTGTRGVKGMKPEEFCWWIFRDLLGLEADDELVDLFHGSGAVSRAWVAFQRQPTFERAASLPHDGTP